jgi:hypothetical protein
MISNPAAASSVSSLFRSGFFPPSTFVLPLWDPRAIDGFRPGTDDCQSGVFRKKRRCACFRFQSVTLSLTGSLR